VQSGETACAPVPYDHQVSLLGVSDLEKHFGRALQLPCARSGDTGGSGGIAPLAFEALLCRGATFSEVVLRAFGLSTLPGGDDEQFRLRSDGESRCPSQRRCGS